MQRAEVMRPCRDSVAYAHYVAWCRSLDLPAASEVTYHFEALLLLKGPETQPTVRRWDLDKPGTEGYHVEHRERVLEDELEDSESLQALEESEGLGVEREPELEPELEEEVIDEHILGIRG